MKRWALLLILFVACLPWTFDVLAQGCAMCKAVVEQGDQAGAGVNGGDASIGAGLNQGIIIMMIAPYILLFLAFRRKIMGFWKEFSQAQG